MKFEMKSAAACLKHVRFNAKTQRRRDAKMEEECKGTGNHRDGDRDEERIRGAHVEEKLAAQERIARKYDQEWQAWKLRTNLALKPSHK